MDHNLSDESQAMLKIKLDVVKADFLLKSAKFTGFHGFCDVMLKFFTELAPLTVRLDVNRLAV